MEQARGKNPGPQRGFRSVLSNRHFLYLWIAQATSMTVQNGIHFTQIVLIEEVTRSTAHVGAVILAFSLPAVLLSAVAGAFVDRFSKKYILVISNVLRVLTALAYVVAIATLSGWSLLLTLYFLTFINSAIGQFFSPAEAAMIPFLVGKERLLPANALFNLTLTGSQIVGLVLLAPLTVKLWGIEGSFISMTILYLVAMVCTIMLPRDPVVPREETPESAIRRAWQELIEGYHFVVSQARVSLAMIHLTLVATLLLIMAMMAPGFASRVLGLRTEDAVYIFAPAGIGMFAASYFIGRFGYRIPRSILVNGGLLSMSVTMGILAWVGRGQEIFKAPIFHVFPELRFSIAGAVMLCAFFLGAAIAFISIPSQTTLQEESPPSIRGRVFAVFFTVSNLVAIPPMLFIGTLADHIGIPRVTLLVAALILGITGWSVYYSYWRVERRPRRARASPARSAGGASSSEAGSPHGEASEALSPSDVPAAGEALEVEPVHAGDGVPQDAPDDQRD